MSPTAAADRGRLHHPVNPQILLLVRTSAVRSFLGTYTLWDCGIVGLLSILQINCAWRRSVSKPVRHVRHCRVFIDGKGGRRNSKTFRGKHNESSPVTDCEHVSSRRRLLAS